MTRRHALAVLSAVGLVGCKTDADTDTDTDADTGTDPDLLDCEDRTGAQTEGPFYPGEPPVRVDIRDGVAGVELRIDLRIVAQGSCEPVVGAEVDLWGADGDGDYSGYAQFDTAGEDFMRGQQITDSDGVARFTAIIPGSYPGRAVHLHVKVRADGAAELTTQVYLPDAIVAVVLAEPDYADGAAQTLNGDDNFYAPDTLLSATGSTAAGYDAEGTLIV